MTSHSINRHALLLTLALGLPGGAQAFTANIFPGKRMLYLRVGDGAFQRTQLDGGKPRNLATVNQVTVTVPGLAIGNGTPLPMTEQAGTGTGRITSDYDSFSFCTAGEVYIGGFFRLPGNSGTATLTVVPTTPLLNGSGNSIPFTQINWTSRGNQSGGGSEAGPQPIPAGTFSGGAQTLATFPVNTWRESCHAFTYANSVVPAAGTYNGEVTYTLSAP